MIHEALEFFKCISAIIVGIALFWLLCVCIKDAFLGIREKVCRSYYRKRLAEQHDAFARWLSDRAESHPLTDILVEELGPRRALKAWLGHNVWEYESKEKEK